MSWQWHIFLANLNPTKGSEQSGRRPVLVISRERINRLLPVVNIIPLTSLKSPARTIYPNEVLLPAGVAGLPKDYNGYYPLRAHPAYEFSLKCKNGEIRLFNHQYAPDGMSISKFIERLNQNGDRLTWAMHKWWRSGTLDSHWYHLTAPGGGTKCMVQRLQRYIRSARCS